MRDPRSSWLRSAPKSGGSRKSTWRFRLPRIRSHGIRQPGSALSRLSARCAHAGLVGRLSSEKVDQMLALVIEMLGADLDKMRNPARQQGRKTGTFWVRTGAGWEARRCRVARHSDLPAGRSPGICRRLRFLGQSKLRARLRLESLEAVKQRYRRGITSLSSPAGDQGLRRPFHEGIWGVFQHVHRRSGKAHPQPLEGGSAGS